ncbi:NERD domain-containing protein [Falsibacillus pallidus]|uniref:NERD domain-containing protein n=1 Tax=Falsibacillus pallidus TaxID=493781 RepID=UPI003D9641B3
MKVKYPVIKGAIGEWVVNRALEKLGADYSLHHDIYVPDGNGGTSQIDHIVVSPFGVFVIETKHYQGWIFGKENQQYWTQVIYKRKERLYNPIWQNQGHIQALSKYLNSDEFRHIHSIIAFSRQSTLKFEDDFKSARVVKFSQLSKTINEWNQPVLNPIEQKRINEAIGELTFEDSKVKKQVKKLHIERVRQKAMTKRVVEKPKGNSCPRCNGELSIKKGKYGGFYGCNNFPKCRYTQKIS